MSHRRPRLAARLNLLATLLHRLTAGSHELTTVTGLVAPLPVHRLSLTGMAVHSAGAAGPDEVLSGPWLAVPRLSVPGLTGPGMPWLPESRLRKTGATEIGAGER